MNHKKGLLATILATFLIFSALAVAGLNGDVSSDNSNQCSSNSDCQDGQYCSDGTCQQTPIDV